MLTELNIEPVTDSTKHCQQSWRNHVNRMNTGSFPKAILPEGSRGENISRALDEEIEGKFKTVTGLKA